MTTQTEILSDIANNTTTEALVRDSDGQLALWLETAADGTVTLNDYNGSVELTADELANIDAIVTDWQAKTA